MADQEVRVLLSPPPSLSVSTRNDESQIGDDNDNDDRRSTGSGKSSLNGQSDHDHGQSDHDESQSGKHGQSDHHHRRRQRSRSANRAHSHHRRGSSSSNRSSRRRKHKRRHSSSSSSSSSSSGSSTRSSRSARAGKKVIPVTNVPPEAVTIDLEDELSPGARKYAKLTDNGWVVWRKFCRGTDLPPEKRKELFASLPCFKSPFATAPFVDDDMRMGLEELDKRVDKEDARLAIRQQLTLEAMTAQTRALDCIFTGESQKAADALIQSLRLNSALLHDLNGDRRYLAMKQMVSDPPKAMPSLRSALISSTTMVVGGKEAPSLFGRKLMKELHRSATIGAIARKVADVFRKRKNGIRKENGYDGRRDQSRSAASYSLTIINAPSPTNALIAGRLRFYVAAWTDIGADDWVIQAITGYALEFSAQPGIQLFQPNPIKFCESDSALVDEEVAAMLAKGAIEPVAASCKQRLWLSRLFIVPKKGKGLRPIINLRPLNAFLRYHHFKMEGLHLVKDILRRGDWLAKLDMKDAYFTIPIREADRHFLAFQWRNEFYQFTCLPFGLSSSPRVYTKCMKPIAANLRVLGIRCIVYLDDWLLVASSPEQLRVHTRLALDLFSRLGCVVNFEKSSLVPSQRLSFLGLIIDTLSMGFLAPVEKVSRIETLAGELLSMQKCSAMQLAEFLGRLNSVSLAVLPVALYSRYLQWDLIEVVRPSGDYSLLVKLSDDALHELALWASRLHLWNGRDILPKLYDLTITTDASKLGYGAWCGDQVTGGRWLAAESRQHINVLELLAVFLAMKCFVAECANIHVLLRVDNSVAIAYLNAQGGNRNKQLNGIAKQIWEWCIIRNISFHAIHLPGRLNDVADFHSRHFSDSSDWKLQSSVVSQIMHHWPGTQVDLFASRTNHQLPRYFAWKPDPNAEAIDCIAQSWSRLFGYAFPPFAMVGRTICKMQQDQSELILIAPWWSVLLESAVDFPIRILPRTGLLSNPLGEDHPLVTQRSLSLSAWRISGDPGQIAAFRQQLCNSLTPRGPLPPGVNTSRLSAAGVLGVWSEMLVRDTQQLLTL